MERMDKGCNQRDKVTRHGLRIFEKVSSSHGPMDPTCTTHEAWEVGHRIGL
jgi:hypothetical protein